MAPVVPIIDMSDFEARRDEVTAQLMEAAENIGFFQVRMQAAMQLYGAHGRQPTHELRLAPYALRVYMHSTLASIPWCYFSQVLHAADMRSASWCSACMSAVVLVAECPQVPQVVNHGIPLELVNSMFAASARCVGTVPYVLPCVRRLASGTAAASLTIMS
jgi:hypothetical protein